MSEFDDQFPQDLPRPPKRQASDEAELPPDESMLSADDLLLGIPEPMGSVAPAEQVQDSADDLLMSLPPEAGASSHLDMAPAAEPAYDRSVVADHAHLQDEPLELSIQYDGHAQHDVLGVAENEVPRVGVLDQQQLESSEAGIVDLAEGSSTQKTSQGFIEKHKPKLVIAAVVLALLGMKFYQDAKKAELAAAAVPQIDPATTQVQSAAIADMQQGDDYVSPLSSVPVIPGGDDAAVAIFGEDLASMPTDPLPQPQPVESAAQAESPTAPPVFDPSAPMAAVPPVADLKPAVEPVAPVAPINPEPTPAQASATSETPAAPAAENPATDEVQKLKADLAKAEARIKEAEAEIARLKDGGAKPRVAAAKPVSKPATAKPRNEQRVVTSAKKQSQAEQPAATAKRSDIQYIGSFLSGSAWGAHVVIAGNLYELSPGQRIANLKVDAVTGSGVTINGINYR